ncbi:AraC family transcriptional regulator [Vitiosangium sp. GDMCC 1.1324]|uniref:helix-turn-helix domain-containing protein n=1 Tax=Vitiosangium sp. (strain GDMCC 1.1324) TaxID=2138576 RepID=UPI000D3BA38B|nr:AraC family transcriptional regulator [Vitiosangium sp. GDMCC 1.1324]PTL75469.1 AraC family transcriptional regulator [Vitiosangium sp. GDMCC 1.1324]
MSQLLTLRHYHHEQIAHSHEHAQLVFGLTGWLDFEVAGHGFQMSSLSLAVVPPETHHACASTLGSRCLVLDVPPQDDWLQQRLGHHLDASRRLLETPGRVELSLVQGQLISWLAASRLDDEVIAQQGAALLLASLSGGAPAAAPPEGLPLAAIDAHIDRHCAHPLQVADLARLCGLSSARFHARFFAETGRTPMDHVRLRRLRLGRELLLGSRLPVGEVAARVGYSSQSAFTAALARELGVTPRQLRAKAREARDKGRE